MQRFLLVGGKVSILSFQLLLEILPSLPKDTLATGTDLVHHGHYLICKVIPPQQEVTSQWKLVGYVSSDFALFGTARCHSPFLFRAILSQMAKGQRSI